MTREQISIIVASVVFTIAMSLAAGIKAYIESKETGFGAFIGYIASAILGGLMAVLFILLVCWIIKYDM